MQKQGPLQLKEVYNYDCFATAPRAIKTSCVDTDSSNNDLVFRCQEQRCSVELSSLEELQDYIHLGQHSKEAQSESLYDGILTWLGIKVLFTDSRIKSNVHSRGSHK